MLRLSVGFGRKNLYGNDTDFGNSKIWTNGTTVAGCPILAFFARVGFHGGQFLGVLILSGMRKSEAHLRR